MSPKMSPSVTSFGREVRDLDADRLLAGDRREDADLGRRERVREVVLEPRDLRDLRPGRELELVAHDARAGDLADDRRVDAEVRERLHELVGDRARSRRRCRPDDRRRRLQQRAVGQAVLAPSAPSRTSISVASRPPSARPRYSSAVQRRAAAARPRPGTWTIRPGSSATASTGAAAGRSRARSAARSSLATLPLGSLEAVERAAGRAARRGASRARSGGAQRRPRRR